MSSIIAREGDPQDIAALRRKLSGQKGRQYWRSLEELADTPGFQALLEEEFPRLAPLVEGRVSRRGMLGLMAASMALAGVTGCKPQPEEAIAPYVNRPEDLVPGRPLWFASALPLDGYARGVLVKTFEGRPVKIEGNPQHPASLGATDSIAQAEILGLYDPDRSDSVLHRGVGSSYSAFLEQLAERRQRWRGGEGRLCLLTGPVSSPSQRALIARLRRRYPRLAWYQHEPLSRRAVYRGTEQAFGEPLEPRYRLDRATVVLDLDADFLGSGPAKLRHARHAMTRRRPDRDGGFGNRLYTVESTPTITGASSDHRLSLPAVDIARFAAALAARLDVPGATKQPPPAGVDERWLNALAEDLRHAGAGALVIAGETQPADLHRLAHAINAHLGGIGNTVEYGEPVLAAGDGALSDLATAMEQGQVDGLLMLGVNPVYSAPPALAFEKKLASVPFTVHCGQYADETGRAARWHLPAAHPLEAWDDARAFDGSVSLMQPTVVPLHGGLTAQQVLSAFDGAYRTSALSVLRDYWASRYGGEDFDHHWRTALREGMVPNTASATRRPRLRDDALADLSLPDEAGLQLQWRAHPTLHDGHYANNGWLQELPCPLTQLTWDSAVLVAPALAEQYRLRDGQVVSLTLHDRTLDAPVRIQPGQPARAVTLYLGQGRRAAGRIGDDVGINAYHLLPGEHVYHAAGLRLEVQTESRPLASTQTHHVLSGRDVLREATLEEFLAEPDFAQPEEEEAPISLYPEYQYEGAAWGMSIDLNSCIGCNACMTACQAENNIPIVGKEEVERGHEMHWIRVDRYFAGPPDDPAIRFQPVPCMHCEKAPCEYVCPVEATQHNSEGLNDMIYNRCVGTRYCSQNCPYKVRRFNWYHYTSRAAELATPAQAHNPRVTVRSRGVMEKCTYCVQRINQAHSDARNEGRAIEDGEVTTACQQVCPSQAIVFGDLNDPDSAVNREKASPLNYAMLANLNTRPRTTYLAAVRNPNPAITDQDAEDPA